MQEKVDQDIKTAMLAGDKAKAETLRGIKSAFLNEAISLGAKDKGLSEDQMQKVLLRESKKRAEAADLYRQAGETERMRTELAEKSLIDVYLPVQLDEAAISKVVNEEIARLNSPSMQQMGQIIGAVKGKLGNQADGAIIAKIVKEKLG